MKLLESGWIYSDVSTNELKFKLIIQKEVLNGVPMDKEITLVYDIQKIQCDECRRSFTPHMYSCKVQVRQHCIPRELKRNMLFLEQLIMKHNAHVFCSAIETFNEGVDFKFNDAK